jgi:beta-lactamase class A
MSQNTGALKEQIIKKLEQEQGGFAVAFKTIGEKPCSLLINENEIFHAASTMKTPVMIEAFNQENEGILSLSDSVLVKNSFKSIVDSSLFQLEIGRDSGEKLYDFIGDKKPLYSLVYDMIIHSSNLATNLVVENLGAKNITQTMRKLGAANINILRGVEDMKAYEAGLSNTTTALDLLVLYEKIALGQAISEHASQQMTQILLDQKHNSIIPALLPGNVKVAHKTGSISGVRHDSGIIILPDGQKYILILLSKNLENPQKSITALAQISQLIYTFVNQKD